MYGFILAAMRWAEHVHGNCGTWNVWWRSMPQHHEATCCGGHLRLIDLQRPGWKKWNKGGPISSCLSSDFLLQYSIFRLLDHSNHLIRLLPRWSCTDMQHTTWLKALIASGKNDWGCATCIYTSFLYLFHCISYDYVWRDGREIQRSTSRWFNLISPCADDSVLEDGKPLVSNNFSIPLVSNNFSILCTLVISLEAILFHCCAVTRMKGLRSQ